MNLVGDVEFLWKDCWVKKIQTSDQLIFHKNQILKMDLPEKHIEAEEARRSKTQNLSRSWLAKREFLLSWHYYTVAVYVPL